MTCQEFLEAFSELRDGVASEDLQDRAEEHLEVCGDCRHYRTVVDEGVQILQGQQPVEVPETFHPRLQHRLFHVDDDEAGYGAGDSGTPVLAVLGMAAVLTVAAWSPALLPDEPEVRLSPIVVSQPPAVLRLQPAAFRPQVSSFAVDTRGETGQDLWGNASSLLFQYSPVAQRYRQRALLRQAGSHDDR